MVMHVPYPGIPRPEPGRSQPGRSRPEHGAPGSSEPIRYWQRESDPYRRLYEERVVFLGRPLDDETANGVIAQLIDLDADDQDREITLRINSPGGSFGAMLAIYDAIRNVRAAVRTVCFGRAEADAAVLLAAGTHGRRFVVPTAQVVLRQPSVAEIQHARADEVQLELDKAAWLRATVEEILAAHTGREQAEIHRDTERAKLLTAEQALEYGIADALLPRGGR